MIVKISELKELVHASDKRVLGFNLLLFPEPHQGAVYVMIPGFRLISGCISPPCVKRKYIWESCISLGEDIAKVIYEELKEKLSISTFTETHKLSENVDIAIEKLTDNNKVMRFFPEVI